MKVNQSWVNGRHLKTCSFYLRQGNHSCFPLSRYTRDVPGLLWDVLHNKIKWQTICTTRELWVHSAMSWKLRWDNCANSLNKIKINNERCLILSHVLISFTLKLFLSPTVLKNVPVVNESQKKTVRWWNENDVTIRQFYSQILFERTEQN